MVKTVAQAALAVNEKLCIRKTVSKTETGKSAFAWLRVYTAMNSKRGRCEQNTQHCHSHTD